MKIYSFAPQAQPSAHTAYNAAPVAPVNPFAVLTTVGPRLQVLDRDTFIPKDSQGERSSAQQKPVIASFLACQEWISKHSEKQLQSRLEDHLSNGSFSDLSEAAGLLNVAGKTGRLQFGAAEGARFDFNRHYSDAVDALRENDPYAARLSLQRAMRSVSGFGHNPFAAKV